MNARKILLVAAFGVALSGPNEARSDLVLGFAFCSFMSWDFSDSAAMGGYVPDITSYM